MGPRHAFEVVESTQSIAIEQARRGTPEYTRVVANRQLRGVGRLDHAWASPPGNLHLSVVAPEPRRSLSLFPLVVGAQLAIGLADATGVSARLKWPNDLIVPREGARPGKLAGILIDRVLDSSGAGRAVVGIGVNVSASLDAFPTEIRATVVRLADLAARPPTVDLVEETAACAVQRSVELLASPEGERAAVSLCRAALYGLGRRVTVDGRPVGTLRSLADDGALEVGDGTAAEMVRSGEVTVMEDA